jgi:thiol-disulfide isomerase/thioredoxin
MKRMVLSCFICLAILTAGCGGEEEQIMQTGARAPDFTLASLDGDEVTSQSLEGQVVVLNFWATWCPPCLKEIPELKEMAAESKVKIIGIALDKDGSRVVKPFVERHEINYPILIGNEEVFQRFNGFGIPHTVLLDSKYNVAKVYRGRVTKAALEEEIEAIKNQT